MKNSFGNLFRITSFGESHGPGVGVVIDGCPSGIKLDESLIRLDLDRRKPGQSALTTARKEVIVLFAAVVYSNFIRVMVNF